MMFTLTQKCPHFAGRMQIFVLNVHTHTHLTCVFSDLLIISLWKDPGRATTDPDIMCA